MNCKCHPVKGSLVWQAVPVANHDLTIEADVVRKHYLRTDRDQVAREWSTLGWLQEHAPGLAPRPIAREADPPVLVMSRVAGEPLDSALTAPQTTAMVAAYRELFAVPMSPEMPLRFKHPVDFVADTTEWLGKVSRGGLPDVVRRALEAADRWHVAAPHDLSGIQEPAVVQGDGNVANMLWDGSRVRLVDFEYAGIGDRSFEVADLVEHVSSRLRGLLAPEVVLAAFYLSPQQRSRVEGYRRLLATFWLLMLLPGSPGHGRNPVGSAERQAEHLLALL